MARILLIDPPEDLRSTLAASPHLSQHTIETAAGTVDALRRLRRQSYDVLLTSPATSIEEDLALVEEARTVRPAVRPIVLAGRAAPQSVIAAMRARVVAVFTQPFDADAIADMVRRAAEAGPWHDGIEVLSAQPDWVAVRLDCSLLTVERILRYVSELRSDVPGADREGLLVAYREVLLNAMEHGAATNPDGLVEVAAVRTERAIVFYVKDPGPGFDPPASPGTAEHEATAAELLRREAAGRPTGGFGLLVARTIVDEMIYSEHANEVLLIKHTQ
jgi:anti-sigma regulatory factor (Ser/Thr protein kinase)/CheY-like chemotaxis protein